MAAGPCTEAQEARFHITDEVVNEDPGAFTATTSNRTALVDFNFEPMVFRYRRQVTQNAEGRLYVNNLGHFNSYSPEYWEDARARVFRVADGVLDQVYEGEVLGSHLGTWESFGRQLIPALEGAEPVTGASFRFDAWEKPDQEWWLSLQAVDASGQTSGPAIPVTMINPTISEQRAAQPDTFSVSAPSLDSDASDPAPSAPTGLAVTVSAVNGLISLSWTPPPDSDLVGYRLLRSYIAPEDHVEPAYLEMEPGPDGEPFAFRETDLVFLDLERTTFRKSWYSPRVYNAREARRPGFQPEFRESPWSEAEAVPFELVPHSGDPSGPGSVPGSTAMRFAPPSGGFTRVLTYNHSDTTQDWYEVLDPAKTYVVEFLARAENMDTPTAVFGLTGRLSGQVEETFQLAANWKQYRAEFSISDYLETEGPIGQMFLEFEGPGTVWLDAFHVYDKAKGLVRHPPADKAAFAASGMSMIRTHDTVKTNGYSLENFLGHPDLGLSTGQRVKRANLANLLRDFRDMGVDPWLQIEFTLDEAEWRGLVEYLAAPYDPDADTPAAKPWAHRRHLHGQSSPYIGEFGRILFEFSNENWNRIMPFNLSGVVMTDTVTGSTYNSGEVYGLLQEYIIGVLRGSPYWTPGMEAKAEFVLGGWNSRNFGYDAAWHSPSSDHVLIADYNGGWDAGEGPSSDFAGALRKVLNYPGQASWAITVRHREDRDSFEAATGRTIGIGTYEAGPGYNIDGLNGVAMTEEMVAFESRVMKSLAAGTATLDSFLNHATQGAKLQNFFTFERNRNYWTSHAEMRNGGQAYPSWMALSLYNLHGTGDFLNVLPERVPTRFAEAVGRREAMERMPEVAVHATRSGDQLAVFVLSRKAEGSVPVELILPIDSVEAITLHRLAGNPAANNLEAENVFPESVAIPASELSAGLFTVNDASGGINGGLPPAATYLYVFEGVTSGGGVGEPFVETAPGQLPETESLPVQFRIGLPGPVPGLGVADLALSGSAEPSEVNLAPVPGYYDQLFEASVRSVLSDGFLQLGLTGMPGVTSTVELTFPAGKRFDLLAWDFWVENEEDRNYAGTTLPPESRLPVLEPTELKDGDSGLLGDNIYYNDNGIGKWSGQGTADRPYVSFVIHPLAGRVLEIHEVETGLWYDLKDGFTEQDGRLSADLEVLSNGILVDTVPFQSEEPIPSTGLNSNAGTRVWADTTSIALLQDLRPETPVELRIVLTGLDGISAVFGIGKLGQENDGLMVRGLVDESTDSVMESYRQWIEGFAGLTESQREAGAQVRRDGLSNLLKYAMNLPPNETAASVDRPSLQLHRDPVSGKRFLEVRMRERRDDPRLQVTPLTSPDMSTWSPRPVDQMDVRRAVLESDVDGDGTTDRVQYRVRMNAEQQFLRIQIELQ
jgi:hypothetical protein